MARLLFSMETIDFQYDDTGKRMEAIFTELVDFVKRKYNETKSWNAIDKILERTGFAEQLSDLCMKRFGLKINFDLRFSKNGAYAISRLISNGHVLFGDGLLGLPTDEFFEKGLKPYVDRKGTIDLKNAHVTGFFSEIEAKIILSIPSEVLYYELNAAEITATCLHEIGHVFSNFEYSDRLTKTNQVLASLATEIRTENRPDKREYYYREIARISNVSYKEFEDLAKEGNRTIIGFRLYHLYFTHIASQLPNKKYNETAGEQLADSFATRFGYGAAHVQGMDKTVRMRGWPEVSAITRLSFFFQDVETVLKGVAAVGFIMAGSMAMMPLLFVVGFFYLMCFKIDVMAEGEALTDYTYDELKVRYKRIRQEYIQQLKDPDLPEFYVKKAIQDIQLIDKIMDKTLVVETLARRLANVFFKVHKNTKADIQMQQLIEELANNDLYMKSAQLKLTASSASTS